jgi:hypothetical protein
MFHEQPKRPIIALLNFCRSGGLLEWMRNPIAVKAFNANQWPLFLMASSQAEHDALVGGLWEAFFKKMVEAFN